jgi:tetratricopeptide (TPR) repeat protein
MSSASRLPLLLALLLSPLPSRGAGTGDIFERAKQTFREAEAHYREGRYAVAAEKYLATFRMARIPAVLFNVAQARRLQFKAGGDHKLLVDAAQYYRRYLQEAEPSPADRARTADNLKEVETVSLEEAKRRFGLAEQAMSLGKFQEAVDGYEAALELSGRPGILFNLAQAQRRQYGVDGKLERLSKAESHLLAYRQKGKGEVAPELLEQILGEIRTAKAEYHRRREAEARAQEPPAMREARARYERGDAAGALESLAAAEQHPENARVVLTHIYRLRGQAAMMASREEEAVEAFKRTLALEPADDGTGLRPESLPAFKKAVEFWKGQPPMKLEHLPPGKVPPGKPVLMAMRVAADPLAMVARVELRYRRAGDQRWVVTTPDGEDHVARLPAFALALAGKDYKIEYVIVAKDRYGAILDSLGTPSAPLAFVVSESAIVRPLRWYKRWWVWAIAGTVAAGIATAVTLSQTTGKLPNMPVVGSVAR